MEMKRRSPRCLAMTAVLVACAGVTCLPASTIVSLTGPPNDRGLGLFSFQWDAISFTVIHAYADVTSSVDLIGSFSGTAYLTSQIGAGTTIANQIVAAAFTSTPGSGGVQPVLQHVTLGGAGTYYIVLTTAQSGIPQGIRTTASPVIDSDAGASHGAFFIASVGSGVPAYAPAAGFTRYYGEYGLYTVSASEGNPVPEPSTWTLSGAAFLVLLFRRISARRR